MSACIGALAIAPSIAKADPTLLTILALSAASGADVTSAAAQPSPEAYVVSDPSGDALFDIFDTGNDASGSDGLTAGVSWGAHGRYHCHLRRSCHTHRQGSSDAKSSRG